MCFLYLVYMTENTHTHTDLHMHHCYLIPGRHRDGQGGDVGLTAAFVTQKGPSRTCCFGGTREKNLVP